MKDIVLNPDPVEKYDLAYYAEDKYGIKRDDFSEREWLFLWEYVGNGFHVKRAMEQAFGSSMNPSSGYAMRSKPHMIHAINCILNERVLKKMELLDLLTDQAKGDWSDIADIDDNGNLSINLNKALENGKLGMIKEIKQRTANITDDRGEIIGQEHYLDVKLNDPTKARELLGKHYKMFADQIESQEKVEHTVKVVHGVSMDDL